MIDATVSREAVGGRDERGEWPVPLITSDEARELALRHVPVLVFSRDRWGREEYFYPMDAAVYVRASSLYHPGPYCLIPRGLLTPERLAHLPPAGTRELYLSFASERLMPKKEAVRVLARPRLRRWSALWDDVQDRLFDWGARVVMPLLEAVDPQRLPEFVWRTAVRRYRPFSPWRRGGADPVVYYAVQQADPFWVLHYWFFYAFNDWASGHGGHNDHEGDWESIHLFLDARPPHAVRWLVYAAHGMADREAQWSGNVEWMGTHPVVYVGVGSHASYFRPGRYRWRDWAYGDGGRAIGPPGTALYGWPRIPRHKRPRAYRVWRLLPLSDMPWVWRYQGFWGTHFHYRWLSKIFPVLQGINGPGGPVWQAGRGRLRPQWADPLGWAGLSAPRTKPRKGGHAPS